MCKAVSCAPCGTRTFLRRLCKVLTSVFCLFANCLLSAQGVSPEMSARAASTEPRPIAAANAVAARTVCTGLLGSCCAEQVTERRVCAFLLGRAAFTGLNVVLEDKSLACACNSKQTCLTIGHAAGVDQGVPVFALKLTCITPREDSIAAAIVVYKNFQAPLTRSGLLSTCYADKALRPIDA